MIQGVRCFKWKTSKVMTEEVLDLQAQFAQVIKFVDEDINQACKRWKVALIGKFLGNGFLVEFIQNELRL